MELSSRGTEDGAVRVASGGGGCGSDLAFFGHEACGHEEVGWVDFGRRWRARGFWFLARDGDDGHREAHCPRRVLDAVWPVAAAGAAEDMKDGALRVGAMEVGEP